MPKKNEEIKNIEQDIKIAYDKQDGIILGMIVVHAPIKTVFQYLASNEITKWWLRPGVFDTTEWIGDVKIGGQWQVSGTARGNPYTLKGKYIEINSPNELIHTYGEGNPWGPTTVTYKLESKDNNTHIILRHEGFKLSEVCEGNGLGWETCFQKLKQIVEI